MIGEPTRLSPEPLGRAARARAAAEGLTLTELLRSLPIPVAQRAWYAIVAQPTINRYTADRWACALGFHPVELWPEWTALADAEDWERFPSVQVRRARAVAS